MYLKKIAFFLLNTMFFCSCFSQQTLFTVNNKYYYSLSYNNDKNRIFLAFVKLRHIGNVVVSECDKDLHIDYPIKRLHRFLFLSFLVDSNITVEDYYSQVKPALFFQKGDSLFFDFGHGTSGHWGADFNFDKEHRLSKKIKGTSEEKVELGGEYKGIVRKKDLILFHRNFQEPLIFKAKKIKKKYLKH